MYSLLTQIGSWILRKVSAGVLIFVLALAACGLWLFLQDNVDVEARRTEQIARLTQEREKLAAAADELSRRVAEMQADFEHQQQRIQQAGKIVATLRQLESWWERMFGNREQQEANAAQIARMEELRSSAAARLLELQRAIGRDSGEREEVVAALERTEHQLVQLEQEESVARHYLLLAWDRIGLFLTVALGVYFFGPSLGSVVLYYAWAPLLARSRPIRFSEEQQAVPTVTASRVSVESALWPGEVLHVREKYLQASDEGLARKTRFLLDWRIPFTSLACGLWELVEMRNVTAAGERRVTFSTMDDPHTELAIVEIPEGASLILRPSFLAGTITRGDERLVIKRRWQLLRWQSWVTLQFRFFEFVGPCRLIVAGRRGVRPEILVDREGVRPPAKRTNRAATIGFTPGLDYQPVRAETFWAYYRGKNPLFDDLFAGHGLFLLQETSSSADGSLAGRFWASIWNGMLKVFGL